MYIDTYDTNNEDERFKKYVEILKSHDQLKKSLWEKINTPEVLKLKEESDAFFKEYMELDRKLQREVAFYNSYLKSDSDRIDYFDVKFHEDLDFNLPEEIQELANTFHKKDKEHSCAYDAYEKALCKNFVKLTSDITPENCFRDNSFGSTRDVFSDFYNSCKPFMIFNMGLYELIIVQDIFTDKYHHTNYSITMYELKNMSNFDVKVRCEKFFDQFNKELEPYRQNLRPNFAHKNPVLTSFKDAYTLFAQTRSEEYGRTRQYLIIGCVVYQK